MKKLLFLVSFSLINISCASPALQCSNDWFVTGYYTPIENEFSSSRQYAVRVTDVGSVNFNKMFIQQVKIEGWGKTRFGWYLGYYSRAWHRSSAPLDAKGASLKAGTIATDPGVIASGKPVMIPTLLPHMKTQQFIASDVGRNIRLRRIDIYTGEGDVAKQLAYRVTSRHHRVCM